MASRQDQLHSHQFMVQRVVSAIVLRETDPVQSPFRRAAGATLAGVLVAALALAAVAVYGVLSPGDDANWRDPGNVLVERESGARYVLLDGRLHPVSNYASALLILGSLGESATQSTGDTQARTVTVSRSALSTVPRGAPLGIASAPDTLPAPDQLLGLPWTLCSAPPAAAGGATARVESVLYVGGGPAGGQPLGATGGLLAQTPDRRLFLLWQGHRYPIPDPAVVRAAFGWGGQQPVRVAAAFANAVPQGPDLAPPAIPGTVGKLSRAVPHRRVGTVVVVATQGGAKQYAVVLPNGLAPISQVQADLLLSDPEEVAALGQKRAESMSQGDFSLAPAVSLPATGLTLPPTTPMLVQPATGGVCARVSDATGAPQITVDAALTGAAEAPRTTGGALADRIVVPPGRGAIVEAAASPGAAGTVCVLTDLGVRYAVPTADVLAMLGYGSAQPVRVPVGLVALVPAGQTLDPQVARAPVAPGA